ncbi:type I polyketide synthase [Streptomyces sp. TS71-3]|uniref:type I polyketide synthase n=1 Tax=Streptomyces sp. TS71-3 TaxID=2733862 RepID=UPI001BB30FC3|nr:type I polyketide synthase [Streptomyces sp. TS71-3]
MSDDGAVESAGHVKDTEKAGDAGNVKDTGYAVDTASAEDTDRRLARDPVAIVGLAARFPKASDVREFWDNIVSGRDCSDVVPESWWNAEHHYDPDPFAEDRTYCKRGGFLTPEIFDPREFAMPPNMVDSTGLVQLLSLVVAKETLHDAADGRQTWHDPARTGVILGVCGTNSTLMPLAARLLVPELKQTLLAFGLAEETVERIVRSRLAALPPWTEDSFPGILGNVVSGRVANKLNLGAANHTVDAACASSLAALRAAVDELLGRRADVMLTGGCDADNSIVSFMCFSKTPALSLSGQVRPFDAAADGTLVGEGIGMLALKRLADAERDGDRVYAVLRGLGSSSDGSAKSIYAPSGEGQLRALRRAYADADCAPASVGLIEAHGTGTPAGDEVELTALNTLLAAPDDHHYAAVGSVKSQIGHTKAAAGAAGLIKAALALHHQVLPPTINVTEPRAQARAGDSALYVNTAARPWLREASRPVRRAGVSAFGFGGVNYHAVLEEHVRAEAGAGAVPGGHVQAGAVPDGRLGAGAVPDGRLGAGAVPEGHLQAGAVPEGHLQAGAVPEGHVQIRRALHETPRPCLWHAPDPALLLQRLERGDAPDTGPAPADHARIGLVAKGSRQHAELLALAVERLRATVEGERGSAATVQAGGLISTSGPGGAGDPAPPDGWSHPRGIHYRRRALPSGTRVGALFAGQGSQYVDMGLGAALALPPVRDAFEAAGTGFPAADGLARAVFPPPGTGDTQAHAERLRRTSYAQPAIGALSMGQYTWLRELGFAPDGVLGHSFGELTALWASGVLDDTAFTALARARGRAMEQPPGKDADPGAMAAVRMRRDALDEALRAHPDLTVCNHNAPDEHALGGPTPAVTRFLAWCAARDLHAARLPVAAAFHTRHVAHATDAFAAACGTTAFGTPAVPVYANTSGAAYGTDPAANRATLVAQLGHPVDFASRVQEMYADGVRVFVEFGPRRTLTSLVERTLGDGAVEAFACDGGPGSDGAATLMQAAVRLSVLGLPLTGLDRYAAPPCAERPAPSKVARRLEGPLFAVERRRAAHEELMERLTAEGASVSGGSPAVAMANGSGTPAAAGTNGAVETIGVPEPNGAVETISVPEPNGAVETISVPEPNGAVRSVAPGAGQDAVAGQRDPLSQDATTGQADPLSRAATEHLAAHTRYLDGQVRTADRLTALLREGAAGGRGVDPALLAAVQAVTEHSAALGEAHARAGEAVRDILRPLSNGTVPAAGPPGGARPDGAGGHGTLPGGTPSNGALGNGTQSNGALSSGAQPNGTLSRGTLPGGQAPGGGLLLNGAPSNGAQAGAIAPGTALPHQHTGTFPDPEAEVAGAQDAQDAPAAADPGEDETQAGSMGENVSALAELWAARQNSETAKPVTMDIADLDPEELEREFRVVIADKTGYDLDMIEPDMHIQEELGIDSLKQVEIAAEMWRRYPVISRSELYRFSEAKTVRQLTEMAQDILLNPQPQLRSPARHSGTGRTHVAPADLPAPDVCTDAFADEPHALLLDDGGELAATVARALADREWRVTRVCLPGRASAEDAGEAIDADTAPDVQPVNGAQAPAGAEPGAGTESATGADTATTVRLADWSEAAFETALAGVLSATERLDLCVLPVSRNATTDTGTNTAATSTSTSTGTPADAEADADALVRRLRHAVLVAKQVRPALEAAAGTGTRAGLVTVTSLDGALGHAGSGGDGTAALAGGLGALVRTVALEATTLFCRAVDFAPGLAADAVAEAFGAELVDVATDVREVGVDSRGRRTPRLSTVPWPGAPAAPAALPPSEADLLLVTGGARGITAWCVEALAQDNRCGYVLLGRTPLDPEPEWAAGLTTAEELTGALEARAREAGEDPNAGPVRDRIERDRTRVLQQRDVRDQLATLQSKGVEAVYAAADVRDADAVAAALAPYADRITGVLHGAGILRDRPLSEVTAESVAPVVDTKLIGLRNVLGALEPGRLRHLVLFSSVSATSGNLRQTDYALANHAMNLFGCAFQAAHPGCRVLPMAWGPWEGGMAAAVQQVFTEAGIPVLSREEGCRYFLAELGAADAELGTTGTEAGTTTAAAGEADAPAGSEAGADAPAGPGGGVIVVGPTADLFRRCDRVPEAGLTAYRMITGLGEHPLLRDHRIGGAPLLPMTAAVGWALGTVERAHGDSRPVIECREFRITRGVLLAPGHPERFRVRLTRDPQPELAARLTRVRIQDAGPGGAAHYEGGFLLSDGVEPAPTVDLPPFRCGPEPHPGYTDGRLFHGPALTGLRDVLEEAPGRLVVSARMPEPELFRGSYAGRLHSPALADLLLQTGLLALLDLADGDAVPLPVSVERVTFHEPLPDDAPFAVIADVDDVSTAASMISTVTLTACTPEGRVLQRWQDLHFLWIDHPDRRIPDFVGGTGAPADGGARGGRG